MPLVAATKGAIARPLKVLIPLIQSELQQGDVAGREHYRRAGDMLNEAKVQVPYGSWGRWLQKNFALHHSTANDYMRLARAHREFEGGARKVLPASLREVTGDTDRDRDRRQSAQRQAFRRVFRDIPRDDFIQERQARDEEIRLHRKVAEQIIDLGFRALATTIHPDRGGSKEAMARANRVREDLKQYAKTRRFV